MKVHYEGTCDVCHAPISFDHDMDSDGLIDYFFAGLDGKPASWPLDEATTRLATWIRHIEGPKPDCDVYSSLVYEVKSDDIQSQSTEGQP